MTAVVVTAENGHTVAFLGTSDGRILKVRPHRGSEVPGVPPSGAGHSLTALPLFLQVYLAPDGTSTEYGSIVVELNRRIKQDLVLSGDLASLYAMTQDKVRWVTQGERRRLGLQWHLRVLPVRGRASLRAPGAQASPQGARAMGLCWKPHGHGSTVGLMVPEACAPGTLLAASPGVPAAGAGVSELLHLRAVPRLPGSLLWLVCRRGPVSSRGVAGSWPRARGDQG